MEFPNTQAWALFHQPMLFGEWGAKKLRLKSLGGTAALLALRLPLGALSESLSLPTHPCSSPVERSALGSPGGGGGPPGETRKEH